DRGLHERVRKIGRLRGEAVEIRGLDEAVAVRAETVVAELVGHEEQDVGLTGRGRRGGAAHLQETTTRKIAHSAHRCWRASLPVCKQSGRTAAWGKNPWISAASLCRRKRCRLPAGPRWASAARRFAPFHF